MKYLTTLFCLLNICSCGGDAEPAGQMNTALPTLRVTDAVIVESPDSPLKFSVSADGTVSENISVNYTLKGVTATPDQDYTSSAGTITIDAGQREFVIEVPIVDDTQREFDEVLTIELSNPQNASIDDGTATGIITDQDDIPTASLDEEGYFTAETHYGYSKVWGDEYEGNEIDMSSYNFESGDGCPNLCGWGNNELQLYTSDPKNVKQENGKLILTAIKESLNTYSSARMTTKGKKSFRHGRIDIRAKLPFGEGLWPALWMLGENIDNVGWPSCGEIDIMELVGGEPDLLLGTAHWGTSPGPSTFVTGRKKEQEIFNNAFHVFSLDWTDREMNWYLDEKKFHTINYSLLSGQANPFNSEFFFIFNIAVGGNLPGPPDATTMFPQQMEIDYIRVFQLEN
ncbi:MAG: beta-glucanase (GH16 family) [Saprospiraceae bacterium]|jgi:beta-glucanase (GH16 family)